MIKPLETTHGHASQELELLSQNIKKFVLPLENNPMLDGHLLGESKDLIALRRHERCGFSVVGPGDSVSVLHIQCLIAFKRTVLPVELIINRDPRG